MGTGSSESHTRGTLDRPDGMQPKRRRTRDLILRTFAQMVVEDGLNDVSIQQIADRAGITHRTIYRYFKTRQELVNHLAEWLNERGQEQGQIQSIDDPRELPAAVTLNARLFDQDADLIKALVIVTWEANTPADVQHRRSEAFEQGMSPLVQHLTSREASAVIGLTRYLASSRTWHMFREQHGLTGEESGPVVAWVIEMLLDALEKGERPGPAEDRRRESGDGEADPGGD